MIPRPPESSSSNPPADFDPAAHPIIAEHVFGVTPDTLRRARLVDHLHQLGPRSVLELLSEVAHAHGVTADIDARLERYAKLDPAVTALVGGRHLPEPPLMAVPR